MNRNIVSLLFTHHQSFCKVNNSGISKNRYGYKKLYQQCLLSVNDKTESYTTAYRSMTSAKITKPQTKRNINTSESQTFDGKWILPLHIYLPPDAACGSNNVCSNNLNESSTSSTISLSSKSKTTNPLKSHRPPILLICGYAGAGTCDWGAVPSMLAHKTKRHVITYDARGIGNSRKNHENNKTNDNELSDLSIECMASDALAVIQSYYNTMHLTKKESVHNNIHENTMDFCVGGVSMGGMVAQYIAGLIHHHDSGDYKMSRPSGVHSKLFRITSIGFICTSIARRNTSSSSSAAALMENNKNQSIKAGVNTDFLSSFDTWPTQSSETQDEKSQLLHHSQKEQCVKRFFRALGEKFLSKPGRKALRSKLVKSFIESRNNFLNNDTIGILAQKNMLLKHWKGTHYHQDRNKNISYSDGTNSNDHYLDAVKGLNVPFVTIHGEDDSVISTHHAKLIHTMLVDKNDHAKCGNGLEKNTDYQNELVILKDCDHLCWITHGHEVADILGKFWSSIVPLDGVK